MICFLSFPSDECSHHVFFVDEQEYIGAFSANSEEMLVFYFMTHTD